MFFVRFRNHLFAGARIATLVSRMKGAAALTSLIDLRNSTDLDFGTLLVYFPIPEMWSEIDSITHDEDQDNQFSYTPYLKDLGLCSISPYSATANPRLYTMIHVIGSVIGFKRSWNARSVGDDGWLSIVEAAIVAGLMIGRNRSYKKLVATTLAEGDVLKRSNADMDDAAAAGAPSPEVMMADLDAFAAAIASPGGGSIGHPGGQAGALKKLTVAKAIDLTAPPDLGTRSSDDMLRILRTYQGAPPTMRLEASRLMSDVDMRENSIGQKTQLYLT